LSEIDVISVIINSIITPLVIVITIIRPDKIDYKPPVDKLRYAKPHHMALIYHGRTPFVNLLMNIIERQKEFERKLLLQKRNK
jgi:UDP-N-acetylmuramyl tripeptide synthase